MLTSLPQPEPYFGAVKEKNKYGKWVIFTILLSISLTIMFFLPHENMNGNINSSWFSIVSGLNLFAGIVYLFFTANTFSYQKDMLYSDMASGQREYARTVFKDWINKNYGLNVKDHTAEALFFGGYQRVHVTDPHNGKRVQAYFTGLKPLVNCVHSDGVTDVPDVSTLEPELHAVYIPKDHPQKYIIGYVKA